MSRIGYIARNPKRTVAALATVAVASGLTVGSGAFFTSLNDQGVTTLDAGSLQVVNNNASDAFRADNLFPGGPTRKQYYVLENTGRSPGVFFIRPSDATVASYSSSNLYKKINIRILTDGQDGYAGDVELYNGKIADFKQAVRVDKIDGTVDEGPLNSKRGITIEYSWPGVEGGNWDEENYLQNELKTIQLEDFAVTEDAAAAVQNRHDYTVPGEADDNQ